MSQHPSVERSNTNATPDALQLAIIQASGGDPAFATTLRSMMWHAYKNAGSPFGRSEEGLYKWWKEELDMPDT